MSLVRPGTYEGAIDRVVFSEEEIAAAIARLAAQIAADHARKPLLLVGVLKGALYVVADLARALSAVPDGPSEIRIDYICVSSYGNQARSSGEVRMVKDAGGPISGQNVVIVEDIVDNGLTLQYLSGLLRERRPTSLKTCALFNKPAHRSVPVPLDYIGLTCPDEFVVGYGLDYQELFRNLPYLATLRPEALS
ncbi:MAG: hypoxanthine phosphoribosyltransferase [Vulcanimicrobiaceae bacterium]